MELILLPSLTAICLKIAIFMRYHGSLRRENLSLGLFFLAVFLLNIVELIGLDDQYPPETRFLVLLTYYCCMVFVIHALLNIALEYSRFSWHTRQLKIAANVILALLIVGIIFNRSIVAGAEFTGIAPTRIAGDYYWLFSLYALGGSFFAVGLLLRGAIKLQSNLDRHRCLIVMISILPAVAVGTTVSILMAAGVNINNAMVMSLALTFMLAILVYAEEKTRLFRMLTFIPFTRERKFHKELMRQITDCIAINDDPAREKPLNLKQMMREFENLVVKHVLDYYNGNQKLTASALGVSEATLSRRARACNRSESDLEVEQHEQVRFASQRVHQ